MGIREMMYDALKAADVEVYLPGQYEGICKRPYVVISDGGVVATGKTTGRKSFLVTGYVPANKPLQLKSLLASVQTALIGLKNARYVGETTPEYLDEETRSVYATMEYISLCAI